MNIKKIKLHIASFLIISITFSLAVELATRSISFFSGDGFFLATHERDPYDSGFEKKYRWNPFTGFTFTPKSIFKVEHSSQNEESIVYVNRHGFLDKDDGLTYQKNINEIRIATIGGSTTANVNLDYTKNWPGIIGHYLQLKYPDKDFRIINAGTPGYDTSQSIGNLALRVMPFKPDIVIIYHAYNDLKAVQPTKVFKPDYSHIHDTPYSFHKKPPFYITWLDNSMLYVRTRNKYRKFIIQKQNITLSAYREESVPDEIKKVFENHMRSLIGIARSGGAEVILSSFATLHDPTLDYHNEKNLQRISKKQLEELPAIYHFVSGLTLNGVFSGINEFNGILKNLALELNTGWVDNANLIPHEDKYFVDRVHFSKEGAKLMGEKITLEVVRMFEDELYKKK